MVRNFRIVNARPLSPGRVCRNKMGEPMLTRTVTAVAAMMGANTTRPRDAPTTSSTRFAIGEPLGIAYLQQPGDHTADILIAEKGSLYLYPRRIGRTNARSE